MAKVAGIPNFKAPVSQTKNGNDYKKTRLCTTVGTLAGAAAAGADIFIAASKNNGFSLVRKVKSVLPQAGVLLGTGIATGLVFDYVLNKLSAKKADKNPMPVELKFARDLKSKDYSPRYDVELDEVILVHKKDKKLNYSPKHNVYRLQNDGSAALIGGPDFVPPENVHIDNGDGTGKFVTHTEKPFIENSKTVKKYINEVRKEMFRKAEYDKNYSFKYDKENDMVVLNRMPAMTIDGPVPFVSFNIRPDGSMSVVSADGKYERKIEGTSAVPIFDEFADEKTSVRKFKAALKDALEEKENYSLSYDDDQERWILSTKDSAEKAKEGKFTPYYLIKKEGLSGGAEAWHIVYPSGDSLFSPNADLLIADSKELLELLNAYNEQQDAEE